MKKITPALILIAIVIATTAIYHAIRGSRPQIIPVEPPSARTEDARIVPSPREDYDTAHGDVEARSRLADSLLHSGKAQEATSLYEQNLREQPDRLSAVMDLAGACAGAGRFDQAIELYRVALLMAPESHSIRIRMARVQAWAGHFDEAISAYRQALGDES